jgi:hypothetical protein
MGIARYLIRQGGNVDAQSVHASTPLMVAVSAGAASMVGLLLEKGADVAATNREGKSVIDFLDERDTHTKATLDKWTAKRTNAGGDDVLDVDDSNAGVVGGALDSGGEGEGEGFGAGDDRPTFGQVLALCGHATGAGALAHLHPHQRQHPMPFRVMSFNIRYGDDDPADNMAWAWRLRRKRVVGAILMHMPTVVGLQEALAPQLEYLRGQLGCVVACVLLGVVFCLRLWHLVVGCA